MTFTGPSEPSGNSGVVSVSPNADVAGPRPLTPELRRRRLEDLASRRTRGSSSAVVVLRGRTAEILWANPEAASLLGVSGSIRESRRLLWLKQGDDDSASWLLAVHRLSCGISRHESLTIQLAQGDSSTTVSTCAKSVSLRLYFLHKGKNGSELLGVISSCQVISHVSSCSSAGGEQGLKAKAPTNTSVGKEVPAQDNGRGNEGMRKEVKQGKAVTSLASLTAGTSAQAKRAAGKHGTTFRAHWTNQALPSGAPNDSATSACLPQPHSAATSSCAPNSLSTSLQRQGSLPINASSGNTIKVEFVHRRTAFVGVPKGKGEQKPTAAVVHPRPASTPAGTKILRTTSDMTDALRAANTLSPARPQLEREVREGNLITAAKVPRSGNTHQAAANTPPLGRRAMAKAGSAKERPAAPLRGAGKLVRFDSLPEGASLEALLSGGDSSSGEAHGLGGLSTPDEHGPAQPKSAAGYAANANAGKQARELKGLAMPCTPEHVASAGVDAVPVPRPFLPSKSMPMERNSSTLMHPMVRTITNLSRRNSHVPQYVPEYPGDPCQHLSMHSDLPAELKGGVSLEGIGQSAKKSPWRMLLHLFVSKDKQQHHK